MVVGGEEVRFGTDSCGSMNGTDVFFLFGGTYREYIWEAISTFLARLR